MNDPIVSPWLIYLIGAVNGLQVSFGLLASGCFIASFVCGMVGMGEAEKPPWRRYLLAGAVTFVLAVITPGRETIIGMIVADNITPNSIKAVGETVDDIRVVLKADVLEIIQAISEPESGDVK